MGRAQKVWMFERAPRDPGKYHIWEKEQKCARLLSENRLIHLKYGGA